MITGRAKNKDKKVAGKLKKASKAPAAQSQTLTKLGRVKNRKEAEGDFTPMKTLKIQLELNLLLQQMLGRQSQKLKKLINLMQEKSKS